jgi:hypothetical protein
VTTAHEGRRAAETHLSEDELATVADGSQGLAAARAGHLEDCADCRDLVASAEELRGVLASLSRPALPQDVALRIDAALARESDARRTQADPAPTRAAGRKPRLRLASLAAWSLGGLAVIGGTVALAVASKQPSTSASGVSASRGNAQGPGLNPNVEDGGPDAGKYNGAPVSPAFPTAAAPESLAAWVESGTPLKGHNTQSGTSSVRGASPASVSQLVAACLANPRFKGGTLLKAELGAYAGAASVLAVYADGDDPDAVYAVAYAVPCTATRYSVLAEGVVPSPEGSSGG